MTNSPHDAADIAARLHRLTGLNQTQIDSLSLSLDPAQVDQISDSLLATLVNGTLPGLPVNPAGGLPLGLPGATAAVRWVGGTASAAPTSGAFLVGDWVVGQNGTFWVCTTAGSPGTWTQATGGGAVSSVAGKTGAVSLVKGDVGLGNVDNTSDAAKQTANDSRYVRTVNSTGPDGAGNVVVAGGGTVSDATTSAKGIVQLAGDLGGTAASPTVPGLAAKVNAAGAAAAAPVQSVASRIGAVTLTKTDVGLGNVDNTADASKPVSTAQATAIAAVLPSQSGHSGQFLTTNGTTASWGVASGGGSVNINGGNATSTYAANIDGGQAA